MAQGLMRLVTARGMSHSRLVLEFALSVLETVRNIGDKVRLFGRMYLAT